MGYLLSFKNKIFDHPRFLDINIRKKLPISLGVYESLYLDIGVDRLFMSLFFSGIKMGQKYHLS